MKCTFCESEISKGTGMIFVKRDGSLEYFCSTKCRKNTHKLKRNPRYFKWTEKGQRVREKEMKLEQTELEKKKAGKQAK
ncbi:MAG: 50S ribosomal protein L24e [Candidatus Micrarchaeota archaeon]|nr:50S ribosomal protein L24e [Candidatus Micrarchaeota archaeon]